LFSATAVKPQLDRAATQPDCARSPDALGNMMRIPIGSFRTVSNKQHPEEAPRGGTAAGNFGHAKSQIKIPRMVVKGGSHLRAPNDCRRYRAAARHAQPIDTSMGHVRFRCIIRERRMS
jgi:hypothetical protein